MVIHIEEWQEVIYVMSECEELQKQLKYLKDKLAANERMLATVSAELKRSMAKASDLELEVFSLRSKNGT